MRYFTGTTLGKLGLDHLSQVAQIDGFRNEAACRNRKTRLLLWKGGEHDERQIWRRLVDRLGQLDRGPVAATHIEQNELGPFAFNQSQRHTRGGNREGAPTRSRQCLRENFAE